MIYSGISFHLLPAVLWAVVLLRPKLTSVVSMEEASFMCSPGRCSPVWLFSFLYFACSAFNIDSLESAFAKVPDAALCIHFQSVYFNKKMAKVLFSQQCGLYEYRGLKSLKFKITLRIL